MRRDAKRCRGGRDGAGTRSRLAHSLTQLAADAPSRYPPAVAKGKDKFPVTPAIRALRAARCEYTPHLYDYVPRGGAAESSRQLGAPLHAVIKTLVMKDETGAPLLVLMHGDLEVSTKGLARVLGRKTITPCTPDEATKHTGYLVGGTSPFGTRKRLPTYMEAGIAALERLWINGGKRGFLVEMSPAELQRALELEPVEVATTAGGD